MKQPLGKTCSMYFKIGWKRKDGKWEHEREIKQPHNWEWLGSLNILMKEAARGSDMYKVFFSSSPSNKFCKWESMSTRQPNSELGDCETHLLKNTTYERKK